ncbi:aromatic-ring hydroxylase C-terminal domain-containing protein [Burkholderia sp. HI2714]
MDLRAVRVRPDGVVAWAGNDALNVDEAANAVMRWFGKPCAAR